MALKKTTCPVTRDQFRINAKSITVKIGDREVRAAVKEFSTGSLGWFAGEKMVVEVDGIEVTVQLGLNMTIVGSKDLPQEAACTAS